MQVQIYAVTAKQFSTHLRATVGNVDIFQSNDCKDARFTSTRLRLHNKICKKPKPNSHMA